MAIKWNRNGLELTAVNMTFSDYSNPGQGYILNEETMDPIQHWCWVHLPTARRMSFDTFRFNREEDITVFLLRWS